MQFFAPLPLLNLVAREGSRKHLSLVLEINREKIAKMVKKKLGEATLPKKGKF
jgi:uncharacterized Fe-S cluster-containing radical SAM superfamily protein